MTIRALYRCAPLQVGAALRRAVPSLPILDGSPWYLTMPTPYAATVWRPRRGAESPSPCELSIYLAAAPFGVQLWGVVSLPLTTLLLATLMARLDEQLCQGVPPPQHPLNGSPLPRPIQGRLSGRSVQAGIRDPERP